MASLVSNSFESPDETRTPDKTKVEVVKLGAANVARVTLEPGWKWSDCIKPVAGTDSCQAQHLGVVERGRLHVKHDDGTEAEVGPGEVFAVAPGHDAWVVGDDQFVSYEFETKTAETFAKGS